MVEIRGFKPPTRCLEGRRPVQLSYRDKLLLKCSTMGRERSRWISGVIHVPQAAYVLS
jgi:hypothetical protein